MTRAAVLAAAVAVAVLTWWASDGVAAQESAHDRPDRIAGHVVQGTAGAALPAGLEAALMVRDADGQPVAELTADVAPDGSYAFTDLPEPGDAIHFYEVSVLSEGVRHVVPYEGAPDPADVEVVIYETTGSKDQLAVRSHSMVIDVAPEAPGNLQVLELVQFENAGDRVFTPSPASAPGEMPQLLRFGLPEGSWDLYVESDLPEQALVEIGAGFGLLSPVPPGGYQALFRYSVGYEGSKFEFSRSLPEGAGELRILVSSNLGSVTGDGLEPAADAVIGESVYRVLRGSGYERGSTVSLSLSGLPKEPNGDRSRLLVVGLPAGAAALLIALAVIAVYRRRRRRAAPTMAGAASRREFVAAIAALDERHEAGDVEEAEYRRLREGLISQALVEVPGPGRDP